MHVPLTTLDFLERAETVYGDRTAIVDEPAPPGGGIGSITYADLGRQARSIAVAFDEGSLSARKCAPQSVVGQACRTVGERRTRGGQPSRRAARAIDAR